jgi:diamine N-acetyltransferase
MMVDAAYQGKGYGRAAMEQVITQIARQPDGNEILICYHHLNHAARKLYARLGFGEQSVDSKGIVTAVLKLS